MGRIRVAMTKITLTFKLCFGKTSSDSNESQQLDAPVSPDNNTSQRVDAPISFGRRSSDHNASQLQDVLDGFGRRSYDNNTYDQQLDAPISSASTSHTDESLHLYIPTLPLPNGEYEVFLNFRGPDRGGPTGVWRCPWTPLNFGKTIIQPPVVIYVLTKKL
ncbi:unnamed protein product [Linum trigynum]|uniref:Uncharacterized protein n=1 Tax=Linum trigynum TaxID=586398 RepID=A0AAV2DR43_9ROSI